MPQPDSQEFETSEYTFAMRPWTREEIRQRLTVAGYHHIDIRDGIGRRSPDRLLASARR